VIVSTTLGIRLNALQEIGLKEMKDKPHRDAEAGAQHSTKLILAGKAEAGSELCSA
jgi:hypothetical protein